MALPTTIALSGVVPPAVTGLKVNGAVVTIAADHTWTTVVPIATSVVSMVATISDGSEVVRTVDLHYVPIPGGVG